MKKKSFCFILTFFILICTTVPASAADIKWVDFTPSEAVLRDTLEADISSHDTDKPMKMTELLSVLGVKYGGNFKLYSKDDLDDIIARYSLGESFSDIAANDKLYSYYTEAYSAVLDGMVGEYDEYTVTESGVSVERKYGLCAFSPIAAGYSYAHYDDFGSSRSYGYKRRHLGHDLMGSIGTPITAIEAGYVEACGWNQYGGWRIGIRSFDGKRYYYYAHLRKDHPYADIYEGKTVAAGEVIGYLGMTGYSAKENVNNIDTPHLHLGLQLIFSPEQKDGWNQIWIDLHALTNFLAKYRAKTDRRDGEAYSLNYKIPSEMWD